MKISTIKKFIRLTFLCAMVLGFSACSNSGSSNGGAVGVSNLVTDIISPVPLVNGNPASYSVYIKNLGKSAISGLSFNISEKSSAKSLVSKSGNTNKAADAAIDGSGCTSIPAGSSCKVIITTSIPETISVSGTSSGKQAVEFSTSTYPLTVTNSGDLSNALVVTSYPSNLVLEANTSNNQTNTYFGSMSLSVVNTYNASIDVTNLLSNLPTNMTWAPISCPNPLPFGGVCQIRLSYNGAIGSDVTANLHLNGEVINSDGSKTALPAQNSSGAIVNTKDKIASLNVSYPSLDLNGNTPTIGNTVTGYITNTGTSPASISGISINNDSEGIFSISDNGCNGQLGPKSTCHYTITADVSKLSTVSSGNYTKGITVSYNNGLTTSQSSGQLNYSYTAVIPPADLSIGITASSVLDQTILNGNVTITNNSNVTLSDLSIPTLSGLGAAHVAITDPNNCHTKSLVSGGSCSYVLTFTPVAPGEASLLIIDGITANYIDPVSGENKTTSFSNSASVNVNSQFAGVLSLSSVSSLNATTTSGTITVTNDGSYNATIENIAITSSGGNNIQKIGGTCTNSTILNASGTNTHSCTIIVGIINTTLASSGTSNVVVTYNNSNGTTNSTASSNVSWVIGDVPSLSVTFNPSNSLNAVVNQSIITTLTITNNGNNTLSNIQLPTLTNNALTYARGTTNSCDVSNGQLSNQSLTSGASCTLELEYSPTTAFTSQSVTLGSFIGSLPSGTIYTTNSYNVTLSAASPAQLSFSTSTPGAAITSINPSLNWTNNTNYSTPIIVKNTGSAAITNLAITTTTDANGTLSKSGCPNTLVVGATCDLTITGDYPTKTSSFTSNGSINFTYSDAGNSHSATLPITANVAMMPVVTPGLSISGTLPSSMYGGASDARTVQLTLTNNTTATNNGNVGIEVATSSLTNNIGTSLTGTLNTTGITNNACNISGSNITFTSTNQSCNVNLVITASGNPITTTATITPTYQYYTYNNTSTTPTLNNARSSQLSSLSGGITIQARSASLSLAFYTDSNYTTAITSLSVEQSGATAITKSAALKITNSGTTALTGITMPSINGFIFTPDSSCATLAVNASCNVNVVLSSSTAISSTDITTNAANVVNFTYSNHVGNNQSGNSDMPSLIYQVTAADQPQISVSTSFSGCGGSITDSTEKCNLNPGNAGDGTVGGYQFIVTYKNSSTTVAANNFTVTPPVDAIAAGYNTSPTNNCNNATLSTNNGTCTVVYTLTPTATSGNISSGAYLGNYTYKYGTGNISSETISRANPNQVSLNIIQPSLLLSLSRASVQVSESTEVIGTISSWYASSPAIPGSIIITSGTPATAAGTTANCTSSGSGATCTGTLTGLALGTTNLSSSIVTPYGTAIAATTNPSPLTLTVVPPPYFVAYYPTIAHPAPGGTTTDCTVNNTGAGITGTCECIQDPNTNKIWTAVGPDNTSTKGSWTNWTGAALDAYNKTAHCGLTGGWSLPSAPNPSYGSMSLTNPTNPGGDWGAIAMASGMTASTYAIGTWMNNNGFKSIATGIYYWSSQSNVNNGLAWAVNMNNGLVAYGSKSINSGVLLVHSRQ